MDDLDFYIGDEAVDKPTYSTKVRDPDGSTRLQQWLPKPFTTFDLLQFLWRTETYIFHVMQFVNKKLVTTFEHSGRINSGMLISIYVFVVQRWAA